MNFIWPDQRIVDYLANSPNGIAYWEDILRDLIPQHPERELFEIDYKNSLAHLAAQGIITLRMESSHPGNYAHHTTIRYQLTPLHRLAAL